MDGWVVDHMMDGPRSGDTNPEIYPDGWGDLLDSDIMIHSFEQDGADPGSEFKTQAPGRNPFDSPGSMMYPLYMHDQSMNMYETHGARMYGNQGYTGEYNAKMYSYPQQNMMMYNSNPINIKVPMAPMRPHSIDMRRPTAPLLLPFHHKNDNRIIPQTFASHTGIMPHYSMEEIQESKNLFLKRHSELDFDNITVVELKGFLREFSLASGGRKDDLISRIQQVYEYLVNEGNGMGENPFVLYGGGNYTNETY